MSRSTSRRLMLVLLLLALFALAGVALADGPVEGRAGRAEIRFLEGMIDHHQMALDMANHCLEHASTDEVRALCEAVIAAQAPEIEQMQGWLRDWYGIAYQPMSMLGIETVVTGAPDTAPAAGMCSMMGGEGCAMMGAGGMAGMMDMMQGMMGDSGMGGMMNGNMPMMQMQHMQMMMMQMQMMQMMMQHMGMGGMESMPGMGRMGQMPDMDAMPGMQAMPGMGGMGQMPGMGTPAATATPDHSAHHPTAEPPAATDHSAHGAAPAAGPLVSDPAMGMGMFAGFDRLTGLDYDLAWLEAMIEHHAGAVDMSTRVLDWAEHAELRALAEAIISAQTEEIAQMEALIAELSA